MEKGYGDEPSLREPTNRHAKAAHVWDRGDLDWYQEPRRVTEQLCEVETFAGAILDPCCGGGNIVKALRGAGLPATGSDIAKRTDESWFVGERDFLVLDRAENIVMNPPFFRAKGAEQFIRHALKIATGKVCAFVDCRFLNGAARAGGLYAEHPPSRVWMVTPRPSCPPGTWLAAGNEAGGGTADYCWLVWDRTRAGERQIGWLTIAPSNRKDGSSPNNPPNETP